MKILIVSPYLGKHFGGGEKYLLDCASLLLGENKVYIAVSPNNINKIKDKRIKTKEKYEEFFGMDLGNAEFIESPLFGQDSFLKKLLWTRKFDAIIYETDGSLFFSLARRNILHIQIPFSNKLSLFNRIKLLNWQVKNTNSLFTKKIVEKNWKIKVDVVHQPMVNLEAKPASELIEQKEKIILNVGRFFSHLHSKRQDVLVEIFQELEKKYPGAMEGWKLVLLGSADEQEYADKVADLVKSKNIKIIHKASRDDILNYYKKASVYWHATGFGLDEYQHPENQEHFGISTVEAMRFACAPVVIGQGGQPEVLGEDLEGLLWKTKEECIEKTIKLIGNKSKMQLMAGLAQERSYKFDGVEFREKLFDMLS